jgi:hypothetical protein
MDSNWIPAIIVSIGVCGLALVAGATVWNYPPILFAWAVVAGVAWVIKLGMDRT